MKLLSKRLGQLAGMAAMLFVLAGCGSTSTSGGGYYQGDGYLDIVNLTNEAIYYLYLSDCSSTSWGSDQLGNDVISRGNTYSFRMTPGCWDLRAESASGAETETYGMHISSGETNSWTLTSSRK